MDCWAILGIEPYADKKAIKIAYAKHLKVTRPDDDPVAFQRLHQAYKTALIWVPSEAHRSDGADWMLSPQEQLRQAYQRDIASERNYPEASEASEASDTSEAPILLPDYSTSATEPQPDLKPYEILPESTPPSATFTPEELALLEDIRNQEDSLSEDWAILCEQLKALIASPRDGAKLANWTFIEKLPSMRDLEFRKASADKVFEAVAEANDTALQKKHVYIKRPVLNYLNTLFAWDKKWQEYEYNYSRSQLNAVFPYLEEAETVNKRSQIKRELYYYRRGAAFAVDLVIMVIPLLFINVLADLFNLQDQTGELIIGWFIVYLMLAVPLQESSNAQATVGKRVMGLIVIDRCGDRINFLHALWRSLLTAFCVLTFKLVVFINLVLAWWRSELLQDALTRSYIVLKPKQK